MACRLPNGSPYLLHARLFNGNKKLGEVNSVDVIVQKWINILKSHGHSNTVLIFDSYYFSQRSREILLSSNTKTICSVNSRIFSTLVSMVDYACNLPGKITLLFREESRELFCSYWNPDPKVPFLFLLFVDSTQNKICGGGTLNFSFSD